MEGDADPFTYNESSYWHIYLYIVSQLFLLSKYLKKNWSWKRHFKDFWVERVSTCCVSFVKSTISIYFTICVVSLHITSCFCKINIQLQLFLAISGSLYPFDGFTWTISGQIGNHKTPSNSLTWLVKVLWSSKI